jgi:restriction endonuclease S subunit
MIDFGHALFNKKIEIKESKKIEIITKWPTVKLGEIADIKKGKSITSAELKQGDIKVVAGGQNYAFLHNESNCPENTITVSASGAYAGYVNFWEEPIFASDCTTVNCRDLTTQKYVYNYLKYMQNAIYDLQKGQAQPHVYPADLK